MSLRGALTILTVLVTTGCESTTEPHHGLDVSVTLSSEVIHPGEYIEVTVAATNRGTRSVTVNGNPCQGANGVFVVGTADRDVVGPGEKVCALVAISKEIAPGEQIVFQARWDGDSRRSQISRPPIFLAAGNYNVRGQVLTSSGRVLSAPVSVRVMP